MDLNNLPPRIREQMSINQAMAGALVRGVPPHWRAAKFHVNWAVATAEMSLEVTSPDDPQSTPVTEEMRAAAEQLSAFRQKYRLPWIGATFGIVATETQGWEVSAEFT